MSNRGAFNAIAYRDLLFCMILGLVLFLGIFMLLVNITQAKEESAKSPGTMEAMIMWDAGPQDVDLWSYSGGEDRPIGFSNKTGKVWDLLRDDLGTSNDDPDFPLNLETAYARTVKPGRYAFNVMCWRCATFPVKVRLEIRITRNGNPRSLLTATVELTKPGQEITVTAFDLDAHDAIVPGSANNVFFAMQKAWAS